jgi:hypothetical protein
MGGRQRQQKVCIDGQYNILSGSYDCESNLEIKIRRGYIYIYIYIWFCQNFDFSIVFFIKKSILKVETPDRRTNKTKSVSEDIAID